MNCCLLLLLLLFCGNNQCQGNDECHHHHHHSTCDAPCAGAAPVPEPRMSFPPFSCGSTCGCEEKPV